MGLILALVLGCLVPGDGFADLLEMSSEAARAGDGKKALELADKSMAVASAEQKVQALGFRAGLLESLDKHQPAYDDLTAAIKLQANLAELYHQRGAVAFKLGKFAESLQDFDRFLEMRSKEVPGHWQRGITCYYAGKYAEGKKQFEGYEAVDTNDVENAVWRYLCMAKSDGVEKARAAILKIGRDKRKPMMEVYALFAAKATPEDVLKAAQAGEPAAELLNRQLFYAHLYLGLYHDAQGNAKKALEHLEQSVQHRIGHYMWDVARVHRDVLKSQK